MRVLYRAFPTHDGQLRFSLPHRKVERYSANL